VEEIPSCARPHFAGLRVQRSRYRGWEANVHREGVAHAGRTGQTEHMHATDLDISTLTVGQRLDKAG